MPSPSSPHICRASVWPTSESIWIGPYNNCLARSLRVQLPLEVAQLHATFKIEQLVFITCFPQLKYPALTADSSRRGGDQHEAAGAVPGHLLSRPCSILSLVAAPPHTAATFFADNPARRTLCLQEASKAFAARVCNFARSRNGHFFDVTSTVTYMVTRYITRCILFNEG